MSQASSQLSFISEIAGWSNSKCEDEVNSIVPKLLSNITDSPLNLERLLETSSILAEKFLIYVFDEQLGTQILEKIFTQLSYAFDNSLSNLPSKESPVERTKVHPASLTTTLQSVLKIVQCVESIIRQLTVIITGSITTVELNDISQVPQTTISILEKSYSHCKGSEKVYGKYFDSASKALGILFQKSYNLQKTFSSMLSNIKNSTEDALSMDKNRDSAMQICQGLLCICQAINGMDNTLLGATWKLLLAFLAEFQDLVKVDLSPEPYFSHLQGNIIRCMKYTAQLQVQSAHLLISGDEATRRALMQSTKFSNFFLSTLCELLKIFQGYVKNNHFGMMTEFICQLYIILKPVVRCQSINASPSNLFNDNPLLSSMETTTKLLISDDNFLSYFMSQNFKDTFKPSYSSLHFLLSIFKILVKDMTIFKQWSSLTENNYPVLILLLNTSEYAFQNKDSLNYQCQAGQVSMYDSVVINVCSIISCLDKNLFEHVEKGLLFRNLFSHDPIRSIFASDCLVFISKSAKHMREHYTKVLYSVLNSCSDLTQLSFPFLIVIWTLNRIRDKNLQLSFNATCPWCVMLPPKSVTQTSLETAVSNLSVSTRDISSRTNIELSHLRNMRNLYLKLFSAIMNSQDATLLNYIPKHTQTELLTGWFKVCDAVLEFTDSICMSKFLYSFFATIQFFPSGLHSKELLSSLYQILSRQLPVVLKLQIIEICSKYPDPDGSIEQLSNIFSNLLQESNWHLRDAALCWFEGISRHPNGTRLLEKCAVIPNISPVIENHFSFKCSDSAHQNHITSKETFSNCNLEQLYKSSQSIQLQSSENFMRKQKSFISTESANIVKVFSNAQESISNLDSLCTTVNLTRDNVSPIALESLKMSCKLLQGLSKKFGL